MTCDDGDALTRAARCCRACGVRRIFSRHSTVVDLHYLLSGSVMILVYPQLTVSFIAVCSP